LSACIALSSSPLSASAQWVQRCQGPDGEITYTASNCPVGHALVAQQPSRRSATAQPPRTPVKSFTPKVTRTPSKADDSAARRTQPHGPTDKTIEKKPAAKKEEAKTKRKKAPQKYLPNR
jgi:hypothetical protein